MENVLRNLNEGDFTIKLGEESSDIIDIFRPRQESKLQRMIDQDDPVEKVIAFLNKSEFTMTFGRGLQRLIIQKFNLDEASDKIILAEKLYDAFITHDIRITAANVADLDAEKERILEWLDEEDSPNNRDTTYMNRRLFLTKISFAMDLGIDEVTRFLTKVIAEQAYDYRDMEELVIFFCHYKNLPRNKYLELFNELSNAAPEEPAEDGVEEYDYSLFFNENYEYIFKDEESFRSFVRENKRHLKKIRQSAIKKFISLYDSLLERIKDAFGQGFLQNDFCVGTSRLNSLIKTKLLNPVRITRIRQLRENVTKKDLVTLCFYQFCIDRDLFIDEKGNDVEIDYQREAFDFISRTNAILIEQGFFELYEGYRFDNLIILSLYSRIPRELFDDVMATDESDKNVEWTYHD